MNEHVRALITGVFLGLAVIGVGGILIGSTATAGLVIVAIAAIGYSLFGYITGDKHE